jgi:hypothetical protein
MLNSSNKADILVLLLILRRKLSVFHRLSMMLDVGFSQMPFVVSVSMHFFFLGIYVIYLKFQIYWHEFIISL